MPQFAQVAVNPRTAIRAAARLMRRTNQHPQLTISLRVYRHRPPCPGIDATPRHVEHLTKVCDGHGGLLRLDERESYSLSPREDGRGSFWHVALHPQRRFSLRSRRSSSRSSVVNPSGPLPARTSEPSRLHGGSNPLAFPVAGHPPPPGETRLAVMPFTGLTQKQLKQLRPEDVFWRESAIRAPARSKGKGASAQVLPVTRRGLEALARFAEIDCWGTFSNESLNKSFKRACEKVGLPGKRAYDLRHTFGTEMYRRTHDPLVVQQSMLHRSSETTRRYILGAVPDVLQRAVNVVNEEETAGSTGWQWGVAPPPGST